MMVSYELGPSARTRKKLTGSILLLSLILLFAVLLQTSFFGFYKIFGAVPDLALIVVLMAGLFLGERCGGVVGLAAGILLGALGSFGISLFPLFYFLVGFFAGSIGKGRGETLPGYLLFFGISLGSRAVLTIIYASMTYRSVNFITLFIRCVLPEFLATALFGILLFLPLRAVCRRLDGRSR